MATVWAPFSLPNEDGTYEWFFNLDYLMMEEKISYFIGQIEICPKTDRQHIQLYFETVKRVRFSTIRRWCGFEDGEFVWLGRAKGTGDENRRYCSKDDTLPSCVSDRLRYERGELRNFGKGYRADLMLLKRAVERGDSDAVLFQRNDLFGTMLRNYRGIDRFRASLLTDPSRHNNIQRNVVVYWGKAGCSKSYTARTRFGEAEGKVYRLPQQKSSGIWFTGYSGQETILIEEMKGSRMNHSFLLELCGDTGCWLPIYQADVILQPSTKNIVFTASEHPYYWYYDYYQKYPSEWPMLERRLAEVHYCDVVHESVVQLQRSWPVPVVSADSRRMLTGSFVGVMDRSNISAVSANYVLPDL